MQSRDYQPVTLGGTLNLHCKYWNLTVFIGAIHLAVVRYEAGLVAYSLLTVLHTFQPSQSGAQPMNSTLSIIRRSNWWTLDSHMEVSVREEESLFTKALHARL